MSVTIEQDLKKYLDRFEQKLDSLHKDVTDLKVGQARLEADVSTLKEDVKEIKGAQKAQIWTLIGVLGRLY